VSWGSPQTIEQIQKQSAGIADGKYMPAMVEKVRIINVNVDDWSVDCVSEYANKRFFDVQVMSPYFHFAGGEGIYAMPEVGALAWLCKPSSGRFAPEFIMGYMAPFDEDHVSFRSGRQSLNPGDIMLRTRDENFIVLRRGGVIQIGATPTAQRIYIPIQNFIRDFAENYQLFTFGGELTWITERDDQTTDGSAPTKFSLKAKSKANEPLHVAELTIGSHGEGDPTTLELTVWSDGSDSRAEKVQLKITKDGDVTWDVKQNYSMDIAGDYLAIVMGDAAVNAAGKSTYSSQGAALLKSSADQATVDGLLRAILKSATAATIEAPITTIGPNGSLKTPVNRGTVLLAALTAIFTAIDQAAKGPLAPLKVVLPLWTAATPTIPNPTVLM